jgi:GntR family transcriptional regulator/MocR family aminotransferase
MALAGSPAGGRDGEDGLADDPMLVEQIRTRMLPRRGISAGADEVLVTVGAQNALHLLVQLLADSTTTAALEDPGNPTMRKLLLHSGARLLHQPVDEHGLVVDRRLDGCGMVYVTPSHQNPTGATMPMTRRSELLQLARARNFVIVEDDCEFESNFLGHPNPALRGMDGDDCVVYVSGLPRVLAPGLEIGFIVASSDVIREARRLRDLVTGRPPMNLQRTAAYFLSLGHYDACMLRLNRIYRERWLALRDALNYLCKSVVTVPNQGGTVFWVHGPEQLDVAFFANEAANRGILLEPVARYCASASDFEHCFRMGVTSIPADRIRPGVAELATLIGELTSGHLEQLDPADPDLLRGVALRDAMVGATFMYNTVYGDPCTIELLPGGRMRGLAGHADEERDQGRWWVEEDLWYRQWDEWAYAEQACFQVVVRDRRIKWFNREGLLVNSAVIRLAGE